MNRLVPDHPKTEREPPEEAWASRANKTWGLDLTVLSADALPILGIVDHGSRACLALQEVESKATIELLIWLLETMKRFGKPETIRTDNESMFRSRLWRGTLRLLRIRPQRIAPMAPWQNGRIERFFGTFKAALRRRAEGGLDTVPDQAGLDVFRAWYNAVRSHHSLDGFSPAEVWRGRQIRRRKRPLRVSGWGGALTRYYWRPG